MHTPKIQDKGAWQFSKNHQRTQKEMQAQATPERKRSLECEDLTPEERASEVKRIKDVLKDLEDLPCKITDALNRTWHRVPVDLSGAAS